MLAVVAVAFAVVVAALVLAEIVSVRWVAVRPVGIHVPHHAIAFVVGAPEGVPKLAISDGRMTLNDVVQSHLQLVARQAIGGIVVICWLRTDQDGQR